MQINDENLKVTVYPKQGNSNLLATASISINTVGFGFVTIKGFTIWKSPVFNSRLSENINIMPLGIMTYGHFSTKVFIEDPEKWRVLEERIYSAYRLVVTSDNTKIEESQKIADEVDAGISSNFNS